MHFAGLVELDQPRHLGLGPLGPQELAKVLEKLHLRLTVLLRTEGIDRLLAHLAATFPVLIARLKPDPIRLVDHLEHFQRKLQLKFPGLRMRRAHAPGLDRLGGGKLLDQRRRAAPTEGPATNQKLHAQLMCITGQFIDVLIGHPDSLDPAIKNAAIGKIAWLVQALPPEIDPVVTFASQPVQDGLPVLESEFGSTSREIQQVGGPFLHRGGTDHPGGIHGHRTRRPGTG